MTQSPRITTLFLLGLAPFGLYGFDGGGCSGGTTPVPPDPIPRPRCEDLDEARCTQAEGCRVEYRAVPLCQCAACYGEDCMQCDCPPTSGPVFGRCVTVDPCEGLGEAQCTANPECEAIYSERRSRPPAGGASGFRAPDPVPPPSDSPPYYPPPPDCGGEPVYSGCRRAEHGCPEIACALYCPYGFRPQPNGCPSCECNPPPSGCFGLDERSCLADPSCKPEYADCDGRAGGGRSGGGAMRCAREYVGCNPHDSVECATDADCPNGFCATGIRAFAPDAAQNHPVPPPSMCIYPFCDDGTVPICEIEPVACAPGFAIAVRNHCWSCVDARSCGGEASPPPSGGH